MSKLDWSVVGNGKRTHLPFPFAALMIGFNQPELTAPNQIMVCNRLSQGVAKTITVLSNRCDDERLELQRLFQHTALTLEPQLQCWPSLGLVVVYAGVLQGFNIGVRSMNLLPSIARSNLLSSRQVHPAHFHNWLGERRIIEPFVPQLDWPEFTLGDTPNQPGSSEKNFCPISALLQLPQMPKLLGGKLITRLTAIDVNTWHLALQHTNGQDIATIDRLFMLSRSHRETANWWLYHAEFSKQMNAIFYRLARAQSLLKP